MRKRVLYGLALSLAGGLLYLLVAPVPVEPVAWEAPADRGHTGPHAVNTRLQNLQSISIGAHEGPEHLVADAAGKLYVPVLGGVILRMNADGTALEEWATTGGRPLGLAFDTRGDLIVADAYRGLLRVDGARRISVLCDRVGDSPIDYADAVVVARDGTVYFTDASTRFGARKFGGTFAASILDILEHSGTGRVLAYDPARGSCRVVHQGLVFANGLALDEREESLFIAETGKYQILRLWITGPRKGQTVTVLENLPGYPDNLMRGEQGRIWVGLTKPRSALLDALDDAPFIRKMVVRLPDFLLPVPPPYGHVIAFDESGKILADYQDPEGAYPETTGVTEVGPRLYVQSLHARVLAYARKADVGL